MPARVTDLTPLGRGGGAGIPASQAQQRPLTARGQVAVAPSSESETLQVVLGDITRQYGIEVPAGNWSPRGAALPLAGAECLVVFDNQGDAFVPVWNGAATGLHELGDLIPSAASARPLCLLCDGTAYTLTAHPELAPVAAACPTYVSGGVFTVPDGRGRTLIGAGTGAGLTARTLGQSGGEETHVLADGEMPSHSHGGITGTDSPDHAHYSHDAAAFVTVPEAGAWSYTSVYQAGVSNHTVSDNGGANYTSGASARHQHGISADGGGAAHNNMQPFAVVNWFIYTGA